MFEEDLPCCEEVDSGKLAATAVVGPIHLEAGVHPAQLALSGGTRNHRQWRRGPIVADRVDRKLSIRKDGARVASHFFSLYIGPLLIRVHAHSPTSREPKTPGAMAFASRDRPRSTNEQRRKSQ
jgi:hypothetical protein